MSSMKCLVLISSLATGCATSTYKQLTPQVAENGLQYFEDKEARCYVYRDSDSSSLSCIKK